MELNPKQQIAALLKKKGKILLTTHVKPDGDAISSVLAFYLILKKLGKEDVTLASTDPLPEVFTFLPSYENFIQKYGFPSDLVISIDCEDATVDKLRWNKKGNVLNILVTPEAGQFSAKNVKFSQTKNTFSLIITVDAADVLQLGKVYSENTEMFTDTTVINIDHHVSNTNYGTVNLIDPKAASTTEVIFSLIQTLEKELNTKLMDENIATLLLTGIITDTGSFQNPNTTPKSFEVAADLIEYGARQQEIIRRLFKTKNLSTLKLWGKVLSKIKNDPIHRLVWSTVSLQDLEESGANSDELGGILDDLLSSAPGAEVVLLLKEREDAIVSGSLRTTSNAIDAIEIAEMFSGGGHRQAAGFKIPMKDRDFRIISKEVIEKIKAYQARRLGITPEEEAPKISMQTNGVHKVKEEKVLDFDLKKDEKTVDISKTLSGSIKHDKKIHINPNQVFENAKKAVKDFSLEKKQSKTKVLSHFIPERKPNIIQPMSATKKQEEKPTNGNTTTPKKVEGNKTIIIKPKTAKPIIKKKITKKPVKKQFEGKKTEGAKKPATRKMLTKKATPKKPVFKKPAPKKKVK